MTNFERIKAMSIEELAENFYGDCRYCAYRWEDCICNENMNCCNGLLKWLNSEAEE